MAGMAQKWDGLSELLYVSSSLRLDIVCFLKLTDLSAKPTGSIGAHPKLMPQTVVDVQDNLRPTRYRHVPPKYM